MFQMIDIAQNISCVTRPHQRFRRGCRSAGEKWAATMFEGLCAAAGAISHHKGLAMEWNRRRLLPQTGPEVQRPSRAVVAINPIAFGQGNKKGAAAPFSTRLFFTKACSNQGNLPRLVDVRRDIVIRDFLLGIGSDLVD